MNDDDYADDWVDPDIARELDATDAWDARYLQWDREMSPYRKFMP